MEEKRFVYYQPGFNEVYPSMSHFTLYTYCIGRHRMYGCVMLAGVDVTLELPCVCVCVCVCVSECVCVCLCVGGKSTKQTIGNDSVWRRR